MPRKQRVLVYVGIQSSVVALDDSSGAEVWRVKLKGSDFVTLFWDGEALFAANRGEAWRLDPATGAVIWHNELKGLGRGLVTFASPRAVGGAPSAALLGQTRKDRQEAAAGATAAGAAAG